MVWSPAVIIVPLMAVLRYGLGLRWLYPFKAVFSSLEHIWANVSFLEKVL